MSKAQKIFCIGFHKTGTTSLAKALKTLGYRVTGSYGVYDPNISKRALKKATKLVKKYDAFQDNPWPILYKEMDAKYPNSKFILTKRDPGSWIKSQTKHFGEAETPMRKWIYGAGSPVGNEELYIRRYLEHNHEVEEYFRDRPDDLLILNLPQGDGWEKLCPFLSDPIPNVPFPHANKAEEKVNRRKNKSDKKRWYRRFTRRFQNIR